MSNQLQTSPDYLNIFSSTSHSSFHTSSDLSSTNSAAPRPSRLPWIDMAKGYGIIFVILGHMSIGIFTKWIYTFHMPLFFFLSGYVFHSEKDFATLCKRKCRTILLPYVTLAVPMIAYWVLRDPEFACSWRSVGELIWKLVVQNRMSTLWFLSVLLGVELLYDRVKKGLKSDRNLLLFSVICVIVGSIYYELGGGTLPWNLDVWPMAFPFFFAGNYYKNNREKVETIFCKVFKVHKEKSPINKRKSGAVLFWLCVFLNFTLGLLNLILAGEGLEMFWREYGIVPLAYASAFIGIAGILLLSRRYTFRPISYIGRNSLLFFAWHQAIMLPETEKLLKLLPIFSRRPMGMAAFLLFLFLQLVLTLVSLTICNEIIMRTKLRRLLGR